MGRGVIYYPCRCGGEICEEWTSSCDYINCDSCQNPIPADVDDSELCFQDQAMAVTGSAKQ